MTVEPVETPPRRSWWRWLFAIAAIVVGLAVAVGAGVLIGRSTAPGPDVIVTEGPVLEESPGIEQVPAATIPAPQASAESASTPPAGEVTPPVDDASPPRLVAGGPTTPPVILTPAPDLADTTTTAPGYRLVNDGISRPQVAGILASVFGVAGSPREAGDVWAVGSPDGSALTVSSDPLVTWEFTDAGAVAQPAVGSPLASDRAITLASAVLADIGVDTASVDWQVDRYSGLTEVTAWQLLDEARTQLAWRVGFDPEGNVVRASGFSAGLEEVAGYPIVGAATAVERIGLPGWSSLGPILISGADPAGGAPSTPAPSPSATAAARPLLEVPVHAVTVSGAELSLAQFRQADGSVLILPSYAVTGDDGSRWSVLAVGDSHVDFVDVPVPTPSS